MKKVEVTVSDEKGNIMNVWSSAISDENIFPKKIYLSKVVNGHLIERQSYSRNGSAYWTCEESSVRRIISCCFRQIGIPVHLKGYHYLQNAVELSVQRVELLASVTKCLYPRIANQFRTSPECVERAMRYAIEIAWNRGRQDLLEKVFGYTVQDGKGKPTNTEFLALLSDQIRQYLTRFDE